MMNSFNTSRRLSALVASCPALGRTDLSQRNAESWLGDWFSGLFRKYRLEGSPADRLFVAAGAGLPLLAGAFFLLTSGASWRAHFAIAVVALYGSLLGAVLALKMQSARHTRQILFSMPLTLESLLLLFNAGLDILPAIAELTKNSDRSRSLDTFRRVERSLREGATFSAALRQAAETALHPLERHVLYHLEMAVQEGASMGSALRALADHAHSTWNHSVQMRVRRLENLVVFPVFFGVLGLLCLTAAVPLAPLLELREKIHAAKIQNGTAPQLSQPDLSRRTTR